MQRQGRMEFDEEDLTRPRSEFRNIVGSERESTKSLKTQVGSSRVDLVKDGLARK